MGVDAVSLGDEQVLERYDYGVLGVGEIGSAIVTGLCDGVGDAPSILVSPRNAERAAALAAAYPSVAVAADPLATCAPSTPAFG